ncbi:MAG: hypothetical protein NVSMB33_17880 [Ktedonobacteraceae bacterium]
MLVQALPLTPLTPLTLLPPQRQQAYRPPVAVGAVPIAVPGLHVVGTHLVDGHGRIIVLRGAARWSLEFGCGDDHLSVVDFKAMQSWGMNTVKFPLNANTYLYQNNGCSSYRQTLDNAIKAAESIGMYLILDLHWINPLGRDGKGNIYSLPDNKAIAFWKTLASFYANDDHIMFEPYSEPHTVDCLAWRDGSFHNADYDGNPVTYQSVGMQQLVRTIRSVAPKRIIVVSGSDWAANLDCVTQTPLSIPGGNIVYQVHWYQNPPGTFATSLAGVDAHAPVIAGEFGINSNLNYQNDVMRYFEQKQTGYLAWAWSEVNDRGGNLLAHDGWDGTASPLGQQVKDFMQQAARNEPPLTSLSKTSHLLVARQEE